MFIEIIRESVLRCLCHSCQKPQYYSSAGDGDRDGCYLHFSWGTASTLIKSGGERGGEEGILIMEKFIESKFCVSARCGGV
jgi:hypothetical protein